MIYILDLQGVFFYYERGSNAFNQTKSSKLALIEMGAQLNTMEEAINSAKLLSNVIGNI